MVFTAPCFAQAKGVAILDSQCDTFSMKPNDGLFLTDFYSGNPELHQRSLGAYHLSHVVNERGLTTRVVDYFYSLSLEELSDIVDRWVSKETKFIGVSTTFLYNRLTNLSFEDNFNFDPNRSLYFFLDKCRRVNPQIKVFQGGNFHSAKHPLVDFLIPGQYVENTFLKLLNEQCGYELGCDFDFVKHGFSYRDDDLVIRNETLPLEVSRGCIFSCKFCAFTGRGKKINTNIKDPEALRNFLESSYRDFGTENFYLADDTFNESEAKLEMFLGVVRRLSFQPKFCCYIRLDLLLRFPRMADLLHDIGVRGMTFGIETFHAKAGASVGKGTAPEKIKNFLLEFRTKHPDIYTCSGFIIGLPYEPLDSCYESNDWLVSSRALDSWYFSPLAIYNGPSSPSLSEFSRTIEQYSYTREGLYGWSRSDLNFIQAGDHATIINRGNDGVIGPSPWILFSMLRTHQFESIRKIKNSELGGVLDIAKFDLYRQKLRLAIKSEVAS